MKLKWFGHASFCLTAADGTRIITDPYNAEVGYRVPLAEADYVTISHDHFDHASVENVLGSPTVLKGAGAHTAGPVSIAGIATKHDDQDGSKRGDNVVYCYDLVEDDQTLRVCHLGDLGHQLDSDQLGAVGEVDVLLIPVGGTYTLGPAEAAAQIEVLRPRLAVPMHFKTPVMSFPIKPVDDFIAEMCGSRVEQLGSHTLERSAAEIKALPRSDRPRLVVLDYVK